MTWVNLTSMKDEIMKMDKIPHKKIVEGRQATPQTITNPWKYWSPLSSCMFIPWHSLWVFNFIKLKEFLHVPNDYDFRSYVFSQRGTMHFLHWRVKTENPRLWSCGWNYHVASPKQTCRILWTSIILLGLVLMPATQIQYVSLKGFCKKVATCHKMMIMT